MERQLQSDGLNGLSEAEANRRLESVGQNELDRTPPVPLWRKALVQFKDPLVILLLIATAISLLAWGLEGADGAPFEAIIITIIVVANAVIGLWQEARAEAAVAALQRMAAPTAEVIRGGELRQVPAAEVVPGDLLVVGEGAAVCADARLVVAASLKVAEAPLTGESEPVLKDIAVLDEATGLGDRTNSLFSGTAITTGTGRALVTGTGMDTEIGRIAAMLGRTEEGDTPLQQEIARVGRILGAAVVVIAVIVIVAILITSDISTASGFIDVLLVGVSLAVAAVPEGLPAILAVVLALGVQRMAGRNAIVKKLSSVETLGSASVICSDKTGTLTKNEMTVQRVVTASGAATFSDAIPRPGRPGEPHGEGGDAGGEAGGDGAQLTVDGVPVEAGVHLKELRLVIGGGSLANDASITEEDGDWSIRGDPTEAAFLLAEEKLGIGVARRARFHRLDEIPFTSDRKLMSSIEADADDRDHPLVVTKGAPDVLLGRCTHERAAGEVLELTGERRDEILAGIDAMADQALRTLGVAARRVDGASAEIGHASADDVERMESELVYLGAVGIIDPSRPEVRAAIAEAHAAGIRIIMITGDHPRTAARIAETLDIDSAPVGVLTGAEIEQLDEPGFERAVTQVSVFARVTPEHKLRIVSALQKNGDVVAMTGDGVNDAPALKAADIGVAMGITGTEVSKEAANMILADDNYATIVAAVEEGRGIFASIRKFLRYLLSSNMGEVLTMFIGVIGAGILGLDGSGGAIAVPLLATHILWINLVTDAAPALALGVDPPIGNVMNRPPRRLTDRVIDGEMQIGVLITGLTMAIATLAALDLTLAGGLLGGSGGVEEARTMAFTTLVMAQLFNAFSSRSAHQTAFVNLLGNRLLLGAVAMSLGLQLLVVHLPLLNEAFETEPLSVMQWLVCGALGSTVLVVDELKKIVIRRRSC